MKGTLRATLLNLILLLVSLCQFISQWPSLPALRRFPSAGMTDDVRNHWEYEASRTCVPPLERLDDDRRERRKPDDDAACGD